jgi:hypothetical protein
MSWPGVVHKTHGDQREADKADAGEDDGTRADAVDQHAGEQA